MKLYNKGKRSFILNKDNVISGGRTQEHDIEKTRIYFDPDKEIEVVDEQGDKLLKYGKEIMRVDKTQAVRLKKRTETIKVVKKAKKGKG